MEVEPFYAPSYRSLGYHLLFGKSPKAQREPERLWQIGRGVKVEALLIKKGGKSPVRERQECAMANERKTKSVLIDG